MVKAGYCIRKFEPNNDEYHIFACSLCNNWEYNYPNFVHVKLSITWESTFEFYYEAMLNHRRKSHRFEVALLEK